MARLTFYFKKSKCSNCPFKHMHTYLLTHSHITHTHSNVFIWQKKLTWSEFTIREIVHTTCNIQSLVNYLFHHNNFLKFYNSYRFTEKLQRQYRVPVSPIVNILYLYGVFISINEPTFDILLLTKVDTSFRFSLFLPNVLFLIEDPVQDTTWHLVIIFPQIPLDYDSFSDFPSLC